MAATLPKDLDQVDPSEAWKPWAPSITEPWNRPRAAHLFRRAAFGATPAALDHALTDGFPKTLQLLLRGDGTDEQYSELFNETGRDCDNPTNLRNWWLYQMTQGGHPLREKLTLFWHNHFATSYAKVQSTRLMFEQNLTIRSHALGKFRPFLLAMSKDPAMLLWLDSNRNIAGAPNENYGRELMELFSLGVGNYTEQDIREAARAFTGWHTDNEVEREAFSYRPNSHDTGSKTVFGRTGNWNGEDIVRLCCDQPACARFLVGKLYAFFVSETPPPRGLLTPLEERFRKSDYDIADLIQAMLGSQFFFSNHAYRKRVKWPVEFVLEAVHAVTPGPVPNSDLLEPLARMGQVLFSPPNVKGWRTGTDWLNSATLLARNNFAETVAFGAWTLQGPAPTGNRRPRRKSSNNSATQTPDERVDPIVAIYAAKPKTVTDVLNRMNELLYSDTTSAKTLAKLEKFLREPLPPGTPAKPSEGPAKIEAKSEKATDKPQVNPPPSQSKPKTGPKTPGEPNLESPEFEARVREALHAMMCLPQYQTN